MLEGFSGRIETLRTFEDHTPVLEAVSEPGKGRVLVVDAGGSLRVGVMGDRLAEIAVRNGWAGAVINGAIRDSAGIDALRFGAKALGATARRNWQPIRGERGLKVSFGDVKFVPGHWIYADRDAVIMSAESLDVSAVAPVKGLPE
jgi:regulator of ribonuclease activity A